MAPACNLFGLRYRPVHMRRLGGSVLGVAAALLLVVGCGQGDETVDPGGQPKTDKVEVSPIPPDEDAAAQDVDPANPVPPQGGEAVDDAKVDFSALPEGHPQLVWTEKDGTMVGAYGVGGGCTKVTAKIADESADQVVLTVTEEVTSNEACTMEIKYEPVTAELAEPLEDRSVVVEREYIGPNG